MTAPAMNMTDTLYGTILAAALAALSAATATAAAGYSLGRMRFWPFGLFLRMIKVIGYAAFCRPFLL